MTVGARKVTATLQQRLAEVFLVHPDDEMYGRVLEIVCEAVESPAAIFAHLDEEGAAVAHVTTSDAGDKPPAPGQTFRFPPDRWGNGLWSRALRSKKSVYANTSRRVPEGHFPVRRALVVPIVDHGAVIGHFEVANKPADYDDQDVARLEGIAAYVAPILRARLEREFQEKKRRQAEQALRANEGEYRTLVENLPQKIFLKDLRSIYVSCNANYARDHHITTEQIRGKTDYDLYPKELADKYTADDRRIMAQGVTEELDEQYVESGEERIIHTVKTPVRDPQGQVAGILGIFWDITDRKRSERALAASEEKYRRMVELSNEGIWAIDAECRTTFANQRLADLLGYSPAELIGRPVADFLFPEDLPDHRRCLSAGQTGPAVRRERRFRCRDGHAVHMLVSAIPLSNKGEPFAGSFGLFVDITERKQAEAELQRLNEELERRVRERTAELQAVNKDLETFSYTVSHDLRAPLRHMSGFAELLSKQSAPALDETGQHYLRLVVEAAQRMGQLIDDLLAFAQAGQAEPHKSVVSLDQLVQEAQAELQDEMAGRQIEWQIDALPEVQADHNMLRLVFVSLLSNALKFTRPRPSAKIEVRDVSEGDDELAILVRDNGVGFDMQYADKLFNVFQRLHRADEFEGTGVGLASVRRIVQRHGGRTWAEGTVDGGASFYFSLPIVKEDRT